MLLWTRLRRKQLGFTFRRQYSIGPYFVDFYCPLKRLVVELDGSHHNEIDHKIYDASRTEYLNGLDILVLRFWNNEITTNIERVIEIIYSKLRN